MTGFQPADIIHGFCGGAFGRDSYACRRVEATGPDWIATRNDPGDVELAAGRHLPTETAAGDRSYCYVGCDGPDLDGHENPDPAVCDVLDLRRRQG